MNKIKETTSMAEALKNQEAIEESLKRIRQENFKREILKMLETIHYGESVSKEEIEQELEIMSDRVKELLNNISL